MLARNVKFQTILAVLLVFGLLFAAGPGQVKAVAGDIDSTIQAGANRLVALQNNDGGWDWPLDDGNPASPSPRNTIGPLAKGLAMAYLHTGDADHLAALEGAGNLLLTKTNNFSPPDGYLAFQLDKILGGTTYTDHVIANFYAPLAAGTYNKSGAGTLFSTQTYVGSILATRGQLAGWDLGMGLVGASAAGASTTEWIGAVKTAINAFNGSNDNSVLSLSGAIYGLAYVNEVFDPTSGVYASAASLTDLGNILTGYQIGNGSFAYNPTNPLAVEYESLQTTAYAILALNKLNRTAFLTNIKGAADYLAAAQLGTGGWNDYPIDSENNEGTGESLWAISVVYDLWVCSSGDCGQPDTSFNSIQAAIDAAPAGATIHVLPGTYSGAVVLNKAVTLTGTNPADGANDAIVNGTVSITAAGATVQDLNIVPGAVTGNAAGVFVAASNVTVTGNRIEGMNGDGAGTIKGVHVYSSPAVLTGIVVSNNTIQNLTNAGKGADGIMVQGALDGVDVLGNTVTNVTSAGWAYGIEVTPSGAAPSVHPLDVLIQDNLVDTVNNVPNSGAAPWPGVGLSIDVAGNPEIAADASQVTVIENAFTNVPYAINNKDAAHPLNASPNWFGSITGPVDGTIIGDIVAEPWCGNAGCTFLVSANPSNQALFLSDADANDVQEALDTVPEGTKLVLPPGLLKKQGGFNVNTPNLTITLSGGTEIENNSPCFDVTADHTIITAATIGSATCVVNSGDNGINVADGLTDVRIIGLEFKPSELAPLTGNGINFAGAVNGTVLIDNYFHGLPSDGIFFGGQPTGTLDIHGNLFEGNVGLGINAGAFTVPAEYNSWGHVDGAAAGDGVSAGVDADPFTHVDLYLESSGTPWDDQVKAGSPITYTVWGHLVNVQSLDVMLTYPASGTTATSEKAAGPFFDQGTLTPSSGSVNFYSLVTGAPVTGNVPLFEVTFSTATPGNYLLDLDETTDGFGMATAGSSTNIYATDLLGSTVKVISMPVLSSADLAGPYLAGKTQEFHVSLANGATGGTFTNALVNFRIVGADSSDISSLEYYDGGWNSLALIPNGSDLVSFFGPSTGFPVGPDYFAETLFRVTADNAGSYPVVVTLNDLTTTDPANYELARLEQTAVVYARPTLSTTLDGIYLVGIPEVFTLTVNNPDVAHTYAAANLQFTLPIGASLEFWNGAAWVSAASPLNLGEIGLGNTPFQFRITFTQPVDTGSIVFGLWQTTPAWELNTLTVSPINAYANYNITGAFSMQGRVTRAGIPVTLTGTGGFGPYAVVTSDALSGNFSVSNVVVGTYTITTSQPRYLNVTADLGKTINVALDQTITALELKGGNAVWTNNIIDVQDAGAVGLEYGSTEVVDADVNFSGKVDIFDLALVGGNFDLDSADAYGTWVP